MPRKKKYGTPTSFTIYLACYEYLYGDDNWVVDEFVLRAFATDVVPNRNVTNIVTFEF